jgi:hydrogenase maturation protein HypF
MDKPTANRLCRKRLTLQGQVQGVGFRPFAHRLATQLALGGFVRNDAGGASIEVQGPRRTVTEFLRRLREQLPPLARIDTCREQSLRPLAGEATFRIRPSEGGETIDAQVTVDTAVCADCLGEMNSPGDPRYRYPFINCTNCGPRYTIVERIPYDRPNTTMADFPMCELCARQYGDPADRRFHAQPVACPRCGPGVWLVDTHGKQILCDDPIATGAQMLLQGRIVAIKGLGGFHLACRADDEHVVVRLRRRKGRDAKPFAVMVGDIAAAETLCEVGQEARRLLTGPLRPIVLLKARPGVSIASSVAGGLGTLGLMLPYTPLHHLLFSHRLPPLVMTSGNYSDEPLVKDNDAAIAHLGAIADAILLHNRRIQRRIDDSVVQAVGGGNTMVLRRARGYSPQPVRLAVGGGRAATILAVGAELKNTICLLKGDRAVLSEHIGDLSDGRTYRHFISTIDHLEALFGIEPTAIAADMHPAYLSTRYALSRHRGQLAGRAAVPIVRVQHHHAHIASCLAEWGRTGPAIGIACDGTGYGDDGAVWGCEILQADLRSYQRLGHLRYLPLPGGDAAAKETFRPALAALHQAFGEGYMRVAQSHLSAAKPECFHAVGEVLESGANCPLSSSLGRWFDAAAALCGVAGANEYEGQAPMRLEAVAAEGVTDTYEFDIPAVLPLTIDLTPMVRGLVADREGGTAVGVVAAKFHNTVAAFLAAATRRAREATGLSLVALSGGCFANRRLATRLAATLEADGFEVLRHITVPCNDGGVALGQAAVAAARTGRRERRRTKAQIGAPARPKSLGAGSGDR